MEVASTGGIAIKQPLLSILNRLSQHASSLAPCSSEEAVSARALDLQRLQRILRLEYAAHCESDFPCSGQDHSLLVLCLHQSVLEVLRHVACSEQQASDCFQIADYTCLCNCGSESSSKDAGNAVSYTIDGALRSGSGLPREAGPEGAEAAFSESVESLSREAGETVLTVRRAEESASPAPFTWTFSLGGGAVAVLVAPAVLDALLIAGPRLFLEFTVALVTAALPHKRDLSASASLRPVLAELAALPRRPLPLELLSNYAGSGLEEAVKALAGLGANSAASAWRRMFLSGSHLAAEDAFAQISQCIERLHWLPRTLLRDPFPRARPSPAPPALWSGGGKGDRGAGGSRDSEGISEAFNRREPARATAAAAPRLFADIESVLIALAGSADFDVAERATGLLNSLHDGHGWGAREPLATQSFRVGETCVLRPGGDFSVIQIRGPVGFAVATGEPEPGAAASSAAPAAARSAPRRLVTAQDGVYLSCGREHALEFAACGFYDWRVIYAGRAPETSSREGEARERGAKDFTNADASVSSNSGAAAGAAGAAADSGPAGAPRAGRIIVVAGSPPAAAAADEQVHEVVLAPDCAKVRDLWPAPGERRRFYATFAGIAADLDRLLSDGVTTVHVFGAFPRPPSPRRAPLDAGWPEAPREDLFVSADRCAVADTVGGASGVATLLREAEARGMRVILNAPSLMPAAANIHRKYAPHVLWRRRDSLDKTGSGSHSLETFVSGGAANLNYRDAAVWSLYVDDLTRLVHSSAIHGLSLNCADAVPQIFASDAEELFRYDADGHPHYEPAEKLAAPVVTTDPLFRKPAGVNPFLAVVARRVWAIDPKFSLLGECRIGGGSSVALSGLVPYYSGFMKSVLEGGEGCGGDGGGGGDGCGRSCSEGAQCFDSDTGSILHRLLHHAATVQRDAPPGVRPIISLSSVRHPLACMRFDAAAHTMESVLLDAFFALPLAHATTLWSQPQFPRPLAERLAGDFPGLGGGLASQLAPPGELLGRFGQDTNQGERFEAAGEAAGRLGGVFPGVPAPGSGDPPGGAVYYRGDVLQWDDPERQKLLEEQATLQRVAWQEHEAYVQRHMHLRRQWEENLRRHRNQYNGAAALAGRRSRPASAAARRASADAGGGALTTGAAAAAGAGAAFPRHGFPDVEEFPLTFVAERLSRNVPANLRAPPPAGPQPASARASPASGRASPALGEGGALPLQGCQPLGWDFSGQESATLASRAPKLGYANNPGTSRDHLEDVLPGEEYPGRCGPEGGGGALGDAAGPPLPPERFSRIRTAPPLWGLTRNASQSPVTGETNASTPEGFSPRFVKPPPAPGSFADIGSPPLYYTAVSDYDDTHFAHEVSRVAPAALSPDAPDGAAREAESELDSLDGEGSDSDPLCCPTHRLGASAARVGAGAFHSAAAPADVSALAHAFAERRNRRASFPASSRGRFETLRISSHTLAIICPLENAVAVTVCNFGAHAHIAPRLPARVKEVLNQTLASGQVVLSNDLLRRRQQAAADSEAPECDFTDLDAINARSALLPVVPARSTVALVVSSAVAALPRGSPQLDSIIANSYRQLVLTVDEFRNAGLPLSEVSGSDFLVVRLMQTAIREANRKEFTRLFALTRSAEDLTPARRGPSATHFLEEMHEILFPRQSGLTRAFDVDLWRSLCTRSGGGSDAVLAGGSGWNDHLYQDFLNLCQRGSGHPSTSDLEEAILGAVADFQYQGGIVFIAPEYGKYSTVGGLGVMVADLTETLARDLHVEHITVVSPWYVTNRNGVPIEIDAVAFAGVVPIDFHDETVKVEIYRKREMYGTASIDLLFLRYPKYFKMPYYTFEDPVLDLKGVLVFAKAALHAYADFSNIPATVIVSNDWPTALVPAMLRKELASHPAFHGTQTMHIFHNLDNAYEGRIYLYNASGTKELFNQQNNYLNLYNANIVERYAGIPYQLLLQPCPQTHQAILNLSRCVLLTASNWATVSPSYREEVLRKSHLRDLLKRHRGAFAYPNGVPVRTRKQNLLKSKCFEGVELSLTDGARPPTEGTAGNAELRLHDVIDVFAMKRKAKEVIQRKYFQAWEENAPELEWPIFAFIGRITEQKGIHLILHSVTTLLNKLKDRAQFLIGGPVDWNDAYSASCGQMMKDLRGRYPRNFWADPDSFFTDGPLVNFGADYALMPSLFEPSGIVQHEFFVAATPVIAMKTGGLSDTVFELNAATKTGNGFLMQAHNTEELQAAVQRAAAFYEEPNRVAFSRENAEFSVLSSEQVAEAWYAELGRVAGKLWATPRALKRRRAETAFRAP